MAILNDLLGLATTEDKDVSKIQSILDSNKDKDFVQRILSPDKYPVINNADGSYSTHRMSYSSIGEGDNKKFIVYPNIIHYPEGKSLIELTPDVAMKNAMLSNQYISFDNEKDAEWFSKNYKKVWGKQ